MASRSVALSKAAFHCTVQVDLDKALLELRSVQTPAEKARRTRPYRRDCCPNMEDDDINAIAVCKAAAKEFDDGLMRRLLEVYAWSSRDDYPHDISYNTDLSLMSRALGEEAAVEAYERLHKDVIHLINLESELEESITNADVDHLRYLRLAAGVTITEQRIMEELMSLNMSREVFEVVMMTPKDSLCRAAFKEALVKWNEKDPHYAEILK